MTLNLFMFSMYITAFNEENFTNTDYFTTIFHKMINKLLFLKTKVSKIKSLPNNSLVCICCEYDCDKNEKYLESLFLLLKSIYFIALYKLIFIVNKSHCIKLKISILYSVPVSYKYIHVVHVFACLRCVHTKSY